MSVKTDQNERTVIDMLKIPFIGGLATYVGDSISYPFETLTTMIKRQHFQLSIGTEIINSYKQTGFRDLVRGFSTIFYSAFFTNFVYFGSYEMINHSGYKFLKEREMKEYTMILPTISSLFSEALSLLVFIPIDCIQTRMQCGDPKYNYPSVWKGFKKIFKYEGFARFFQGSYLYACHNLIYTPTIYTIYERFKQYTIEKTRLEYLKRGVAPPPNEEIFNIKQSLIGTVIATSFAVLLTNIIYTIVIRYQLTNFELKGNSKLTGFDILRKGYQINGFTSLSTGFVARMITANMSAMVYLPIYEKARQHFGVEIDF